MQYPVILGFILVLLILSGCGGGGGSSLNAVAPPVSSAPPPIDPGLPLPLPLPHSQCSQTQAKAEILQHFEDLYLFNDPAYPSQTRKYAVARADLEAFPDVDDLLDFLRFQSGVFDRGFTYYSTREEVEQFFDLGEFVGFGFSVALDSDLAWRLIDVFADSPADDAGWQRGDTILSVGGVATGLLSLTDPQTFGDSTAGVMRTFELLHNDGTSTAVTLAKRVVDIDPVPDDRIRTFDVGGLKVGYVFFRSFVTDADNQLRSAIATLKSDGVTEMIVDVRYNGGGLVNTAEILGGLLVGPAGAGQLYFEFRHNPDIASVYNEPRFFPVEPDGFDGLQSLYFLTDSGSASASELSISGMSAYIPTTVVGNRTFGKPVGQWGLRYCNDSMVLFLVVFKTVNLLGEGDYFDGIPADCAAEDDWDHLLGDPQEARLAAALDHVASNGSICTIPPTLGSMSLRGGDIVDIPANTADESLARRWVNAL